jgi:hypothetical protein
MMYVITLEYSGCRTVTVIYWQCLPSPVIQINQVGLRMSPISLDPEFPSIAHISSEPSQGESDASTSSALDYSFLKCERDARMKYVAAG